MRLFLLFVLLLLMPGVAQAANTHGNPNTEQQMYWADATRPYVVRGCLPVVPASGVAFAAFACDAYVLGTSGELLYVTQPAAALTLPNVAGTHWLGVCRDQTSVVSGWTRQQGTHYVHRQSVSEPTTPTGCLVLAQAQVASSSITVAFPVAQTLALSLERQTGGTIIHASTAGVRCDGVQVESHIIQYLIDRQKAAGGGTVLLPRGTCVVDTLHMDDQVTLQGAGRGRTILSHTAHTDTHRPVIRIGDAGDTSKGGQSKGAVTEAQVRDLSIDGNRASQVANEFAPGIMIWGSDNNVVSQVEIYDVSGDGITIGYDTERLAGSHRNRIEYCDIQDVHPNRQGIAIVWGNQNQILFNTVGDFIDLELDAGVGEIKHNLVQGNTGRVVSGSATTILPSDLGLAVVVNGGTAADKARFFGNVFQGNIAYQFKCIYGVVTTFTGNTLVGSNATQQYLMELDACDDTTIVGNTLIANKVVATALVALVRTRATSQLTVTQNNVNKDTLPFHSFVSTYAAEPAAVNQIFTDNNASGVGDYRTGSSTSMVTESSVYRLQFSGGTPQVFTATRVQGPALPLTFASGGGLGQVLNVTVTFASGAGLWRLEVLPYGTVGKTTEPWDYALIATVDEIGGTRAIEVWGAPLGGAAPVWGHVNFNSAGSIGVVFLRFWY
jgi:hypothetical protein